MGHIAADVMQTATTPAGAKSRLPQTEEKSAGARMVITLDDLTAKTPDLPILPAAVLRVMREADSSDATASDVARALGTDQGLSARVLRMANSAYYGLPRQVGDLRQAVIVLGLRTIKRLALLASTFPWLSRPIKRGDEKPETLWPHSYACACGARVMAMASGKCSEDEAFAAGLLHDVGRLAMHLWMSDKMPAIAHLADREALPLDEAEHKVLGFDHAEAGARMASEWGLPDNMVAAIRYHHRPERSMPNEALIDCVHAALMLEISAGLPCGFDGERCRFSREALERLGLRIQDLAELGEKLREECEGFQGLMEIAA